ncbi:hypothetical protein COV11_04345 [Candidatus Woesearchaeota archaeon CG10_big_fil_rev_8_21_14_0_10_30_7]|nr:MAG: hypothetical protein COV11_04345 [Candidatus Woesearchaeota archaeon CG10_big_fil_rev_8_21_14_0_10_30_7]
MSEIVEHYFDNAKKELRRADHLFFVSLKYTRTVDVLKSLVMRLISSFHSANQALLQKVQETGEIEELPELPRIIVDKVKTCYANENLSNYLDLYLLLRRIDRAEFERAREFRRHVTMTAFVDDEKIEITIDIAFDYYTKTKEYLNQVRQILYGKDED